MCGLPHEFNRQASSGIYIFIPSVLCLGRKKNRLWRTMDVLDLVAGRIAYINGALLVDVKMCSEESTETPAGN